MIDLEDTIAGALAVAMIGGAIVLFVATLAIVYGIPLLLLVLLAQATGVL